jgi:hypothetical protein
MGNSFWVGLMPFLEGDAVYKQWNQVISANGALVTFTGSVSTPSWSPGLSTNLNVVGFSGSGAGGSGGSQGAGYKPASMLCPSSPLPTAITVTTTGGQNAQVVQPTYAGIAGAVARQMDAMLPTSGGTVGGMVLGLPSGFIGSLTPTTPGYSQVYDTRITQSSVTPPAGNSGYTGGSGVFIPNKSIGLAGVSDGTTCTICIGEQSAFQWTIQGTPTTDSNGMAIGLQTDCRASAPYGAFSGCTGLGPVDGKGTATSFHGAAWNLATVRWPINAYTPAKWNQAANNPQLPQPIATASLAGVGVGCANNPIQSQHPSGAMALLCDGSARLLRNELDLTLLKRLCIRDDRLIATLPD